MRRRGGDHHGWTLCFAKLTQLSRQPAVGVDLSSDAECPAAAAAALAPQVLLLRKCCCSSCCSSCCSYAATAAPAGAAAAVWRDGVRKGEFVLFGGRAGVREELPARSAQVVAGAARAAQAEARHGAPAGVARDAFVRAVELCHVLQREAHDARCGAVRAAGQQRRLVAPCKVVEIDPSAVPERRERDQHDQEAVQRLRLEEEQRRQQREERVDGLKQHENRNDERRTRVDVELLAARRSPSPSSLSLNPKSRMSWCTGCPLSRTIQRRPGWSWAPRSRRSGACAPPRSRAGTPLATQQRRPPVRPAPTRPPPRTPRRARGRTWRLREDPALRVC